LRAAWSRYLFRCTVRGVQRVACQLTRGSRRFAKARSALEGAGPSARRSPMGQ
jgi:hypothetical protein